MGFNKITLIDHIRAIEDINRLIEMERGTSEKKSLLNVKKYKIRKTKELINHLNSVGKLSDKETISLLSLDFLNAKKFNLKYRIGRFY